MTTGGGDSTVDIVGPGALGARIGLMPASWDFEADVVIIGAGATGLPAAIVASGMDVDFGKPTPQHQIWRPPFYAAWATPLVHDTRAGLRINAQCQVVDMQGQVIPGLYCGGESAGGFNQHGLGRCTAQGYIAGKNAAAERS